MKSNNIDHDKFGDLETEYEIYTVNREVLHHVCNAKRGAGGVAVIYKKIDKTWHQSIDALHQDMVWLVLDADFFCLPRNIYIGFVYIPPADSNILSYTDQDYLVTLEHQIARFISKGEVMVVGDMNARTENLAQNNETNSVHVTINESVTISEPQRNSRDNKINEHGRALYELCQSSSMLIMNGHHAGDNPGSFTCVRPQGSSVVDYALVSPPYSTESGFKR